MNFNDEFDYLKCCFMINRDSRDWNGGGSLKK